MTRQGQLDFGAEGGGEGYSRWLAGRQIATRELARRLNLPLGHQVEVRLGDGVCLRGKLRLQEDFLMLEEDQVRRLGLLVDRTPFTYREIESCVRLD